MPPKRQRHSASSSRAPAELTREDPEFHGIVLIDPTDRPRWNKVISRRIEPTRYADHTLLREMGIYDDVKQLFLNVGWLRIFIGGWPTYERVVLEMLSTIQHDHGELSFQLNNMWEGSVSILNYLRALNCPTGGHTMRSIGGQFSAAHFWGEITLPGTGAFLSGHSNAIDIRSPVLRMVHRILAHTVLARKENSHVRDLELFVIWAMLTSTQLDMNEILISQVMRAAHSTAGTIVIGGMLTPLALSICPAVSTWEVVPGPTLLDGRRMAAGRFLTRAQPPFKLWQNQGDHFPLPYPALTRVQGRYDTRNWLMNTAAHNRAIAGEAGVEHGAEEEEESADDEDYEEEEEEEEEAEEEAAPTGAHASRGTQYGIDELTDRMRQLHTYAEQQGTQLDVMRTDVTAVRLQQQQMDAYQREQFAHYGEFETYARGEFAYNREQFDRQAAADEWQRQQLEWQRAEMERQQQEHARQMAMQEEHFRQFQEFQRRYGGPPS